MMCCIECIQIMHYTHQKMRPKKYYHDKIMEFIVNYPDIVEKLITSINVSNNEDQSYDVKCRVVWSILLESVLKNRIHKIGLLISTVNSARKHQLKDESDFGADL